MGIFGKKKGPTLTVEERFVLELNAVVAGAAEPEIAEFADWVFDYIPLLLAQASRPTSPFLEKVKQTVLGSGKKLIWRALSPVDCLKNVVRAIETHAPDIQRIFLAQVERYKRERQQLDTLQLAQAERRASAIEVTCAEQRMLEPVK